MVEKAWGLGDRTFIPKESMRRMAALDLEIDFDLYVSGEFYKR
jgi:hypothetical protein